jgi:hypothetical protein
LSTAAKVGSSLTLLSARKKATYSSWWIDSIVRWIRAVRPSIRGLPGRFLEEFPNPAVCEEKKEGVQLIILFAGGSQVFDGGSSNSSDQVSVLARKVFRKISEGKKKKVFKFPNPAGLSDQVSVLARKGNFRILLSVKKKMDG